MEDKQGNKENQIGTDQSKGEKKQSVLAKPVENSEKDSSGQSFSPKLFLTQVNAEMKKVSWSTKQELINYTGVVGIAVAVVCALIWICDTFFARLFHVILH